MVKKKAAPGRCLESQPGRGSAAGSGGAASRTGTAAARTEINGAGQTESDIDEIHLDGLGLLPEILVYNVPETINIVYRVRVSRLIQSHRQRWTASPSLVEENTDWGNFPTLEIFSYLFSS